MRAVGSHARNRARSSAHEERRYPNRADRRANDPLISGGGAAALTWAGIVVLFSLLTARGYVPFVAFHSMIDLLVAAVSLSVFFIAWHTRALVDDDFLTLLGITHLFVSVITGLHLLAYERMDGFAPGGAYLELGAELWLILRAILAVGILWALFYIGRRLRRTWLPFVAFGIPAATACWLAFVGMFPPTNEAGQGPTLFKISVELIIVAIMLLGLGRLWMSRNSLDTRVFQGLFAAIVLMIVAELMFMMYKSPFDYLSLGGHIVHLGSLHFIYSALVARTLRDPFSALFRRIHESEEKFRTVVDNVQDGVNMLDLASGKYVLMNPSQVQMTGFSMEEINDASLETVYRRVHPDDREIVSQQLQLATQGIEPVPAVEYRWKVKGGDYRWISDRRGVVRDSDGKPIALVGASRDITDMKARELELASRAEEERKNAELHQALTHIDQMIHATFDRQRIFEKLLGEAARAVGADSAFFMTANSGGWLLEESFGLPEDSRDLVITGDQAPLSELAVSTGKPVLLENSSLDPRTQGSPLLAMWSVQAMLLTPVLVVGKPVGVVALNYAEPHSFAPQEVFFAERLCASLGLALANIELYETEHDIAETLQATLIALPARVSGIVYSSAYESATYQSGRVGGDFVDIFEVHGHWVGITLGDVSGKGIEAAVITSLVRTTLRVHALDGLSPAETAMKANLIVRRFTEVDSFVTLWFGLLNTLTGQLRYICGGHPRAVILPAEQPLRELECRDPILGAFDDVLYSESHTVMEPGDRLILYSDGVTEARSPGGAFFGTQRLLDVLQSLAGRRTRDIGQAVMTEVIDFSEAILRDDAAILAVEPTRLRARPASDDAQLQAFPHTHHEGSSGDV